MNDWLLLQLAAYGIPLLFITTYLSCLAVPVPSSLMMLAAGAFIASGDLPLSSTAIAALAGAILGDQTGYGLGRFGSAPVDKHLATRPKSAALFTRAQEFTSKWGGLGVYFSRWLVSPLGPYVNFASGLTRHRWAGFTFWGVLGEMTWVTLYIGLGFTFAQNIGAVAEIAADISGVLAAGLVTVALGLWLRHVLHVHATKIP